MEESHCDSVEGRNQDEVRQLEGMGHGALVNVVSTGHLAKPRSFILPTANHRLCCIHNNPTFTPWTN